MGRPSEYTEEKADAICERIVEGQSIREICRAEDMPAMGTVFRWLSQYTDFQEQYARAKEAQAEYLAEEMLDISDDGSNDWMERRNTEGDVVGESVNGEAIQRSKLRVDTRKWLLAKLKPKRYGEKVQQEHTGPEGGPIEVSKIERRIVDPDENNPEESQ